MDLIINHPRENVFHKNEEIGRDGVTLTQTPTTFEETFGDSVHDHGEPGIGDALPNQ